MSEFQETSPTEVCVVGSTMMDFVSYTDKLPAIGETRHGSSFEKNFGGKGANQAVQCAKLGIQCSFIGCTGGDVFGEEYKAEFRKLGIRGVFQESSSSSTGIASITVEDSGQNTIVIIPGANMEITPAFVGENRDLIADAAVLICQNEISLNATRSALEIARATNTISILNPAPANASVKELVTLCDIVTPNETELAIITGMPTRTLDEIKLAVTHLLSTAAGCKIVVVTLGAAGAYMARKGSDGTEVQQEIFDVPTKVTAIDTVGAGDSFLGAFAANLARGATLEESIQRGIYVASLSVTRRGSQKSYFTHTDGIIAAEQLPPPRSSLNSSSHKASVHQNLFEVFFALH